MHSPCRRYGASKVLQKVVYPRDTDGPHNAEEWRNEIMSMQLTRRALAMAGAAWILADRSAAAQSPNWPERPLRLVIGFPPGGSSDVMARLVAERLAPRLGQPVVPENRPGAGAMIAAENVARAPADGYSVLFMSNSLIAAAATMPRPAIDLTRDLAPISGLAEGPLLYVASRTAPFDTIQGLVDWARRNPGMLNIGVPGTGTTNHLALELLVRRLGLDVTVVPYQGNAPALTALLRGDIPVISDNLLTSMSLIREGNIRPLAVTGRSRAPLLSEVPTVAESVLPDYAATFWSSLMCAANTPLRIVERLEAETAAAMARPDILTTIKAQGFEPIAHGAESLRQRIASETELWGRVAQEAGLPG